MANSGNTADMPLSLPSVIASRLSADQQRSYGIATQAAASVLRRRLRVLRLIRDAYAKLHTEEEAMNRMRIDLMKLLRLVKSWALGQYEQVPWRALLFALGGILYFLLPVDLIPDYLPGVGFLDDAAVISSVVHALKADLEAYERWQRNQLETGTTPALPEEHT